MKRIQDLPFSLKLLGVTTIYVLLSELALAWLCRLREHFEVEGDTVRRENVVVVRYGDQKVGLVVDKLMGEFQTVIKPLGNPSRNPSPNFSLSQTLRPAKQTLSSSKGRRP